MDGPVYQASEGKETAEVTIERTTLEMSFADGEGVLAVGPDHPLVSVFRRAAETGKYTGHWLYLIARPSRSAKPKLLGTVAWSPGSRFLFFPGKLGEVLSTHPDQSLNGRRIDHVTLELDAAMSSFDEHVAVLGGTNTRGQRRRGKVHDGHLHPWFSLLLRSLDAYASLPAQFKLQMAIPSADVTRRCEAMMGTGTRTAMCFPDPKPEGTYYYQLDVWAGRGDGWRKKYADTLPWPAFDGVIEDHRGELVDRSGQVHDVASDCGIAVVLSRPSGMPTVGGLVHAAIEPLKKPRS